jgi:hypothetical protein
LYIKYNLTLSTGLEPAVGATKPFPLPAQLAVTVSEEAKSIFPVFLVGALILPPDTITGIGSFKPAPLTDTVHGAENFHIPTTNSTCERV